MLLIAAMLSSVVPLWLVVSPCITGIFLAHHPLRQHLLGEMSSVSGGGRSERTADAMAAKMAGVWGGVAMVPLLNVICVLVLSHFTSGPAPGIRKILLDLIRNPFIWSTATGLLLNVTGLPLPRFAWSTLEILGSAALPIGIVCVGAGLDLNALRRPGPALTSALLLKLALMPVLGFGFASLMGVEGPAFTAVMIAMSVPSAGGSYLLARQMGGDAKLMAEILTLQTLAAAVTMPIALLVAV